MTMKLLAKFSLGVSALSASLLFTASTALSESLKKVVVGHDLWVGYSGAFVAEEKGFFEQNGLNVDFVQFPGPGDTLPALITGKLDVGLTTLHNLALASLGEGVELKAVYLLDTSDGADAIVASTNIKNVSDLKGKTVAATENEVNHLMLIAALDSVGLSEKDIKFVNMNAEDAGAAFVAGKLDAAVTWEPWVTKASSNGGNIIFTSADIPDTILDAVVVSPEDLKSSKESISAFISAIDRGVKYMEANPTESHEIISKYLDIPAAEIEEMLATDKIYDMDENKKLFKGPASISLEKVVSFLKSKQLIPAGSTGEKLLDDSLIAY